MLVTHEGGKTYNWQDNSTWVVDADSEALEDFDLWIVSIGTCSGWCLVFSRAGRRSLASRAILLCSRTGLIHGNSILARRCIARSWIFSVAVA
jgi:hypothetical protein